MGFMQPKDKLFGRDVSRNEKISIPVGASRKDRFLAVEQMHLLYDSWEKRSLPIPIYKEGKTDNAPYAVKSQSDLERVYQSLRLFLAQYLCCGCNLMDLATLKYDSFYLENE